MRLTLLSRADLERALPMPAAIEVAREAFAAQAAGRVRAPLRTSLAIEEHAGTTLVMPAYLAGAGIATKVVSVFPGNVARGRAAISGLVVVCDETSGEPVGLLEGAALTAWRTGAASGAATTLLARPDVRRGACLGTGVQGRTQLLALCAARPVERVALWDRSRAQAERLARAVRDQVAAELTVVESAAEALAGAEVVCTATPATAPLFPAAALEPGAHLNSVGSFTPQMGEVDPALAAGARVFVDDREAALAEAGELLAAVAAGHTTPEAWTLLGDVQRGVAQGRRSADERTWFKSVGLAVQDVTAAAAALGAAREQGLGRTLEL